MKILKRKEFLAMPPNTLYAEYEPSWFGPMMIKMETSTHGNDWVEQDIVDAVDANSSEDLFKKLDLAVKQGGSLKMDYDCGGRNGMFDDDDSLYAVYEKEDVEQLINRLKECLNN